MNWSKRVADLSILSFYAKAIESIAGFTFISDYAWAFNDIASANKLKT